MDEDMHCRLEGRSEKWLDKNLANGRKAGLATFGAGATEVQGNQSKQFNQEQRAIREDCNRGRALLREQNKN